MMTTEFCKAIEQRVTYHRKPDTKCSFYHGSGRKGLFPYRINATLTGDGFKRITRTGRALEFVKKGEVRAVFTKPEHGSPYQLGKDARIHFSLWESEEYPFLLGFSSVGRTNAHGQIEDTNDLVIALGNADTLEFRIFPGAYEQRDGIFAYLRECLS